MTIKSGAMLFAVTITVAGCGSWSPFSGPTEQSRIPRDAVVYQCEGSKTLAVRIEENGKSAMVIFPEREFRLDQTDGARYSNGRTTLHLEDSGAWLEENQARTYSDCKKKGA
jgi:membrane-bound inhibitor of C-type lysozyme